MNDPTKRRQPVETEGAIEKQIVESTPTLPAEPSASRQHATAGTLMPAFIHGDLDDLGLSSGVFRLYCHINRRAGNGTGKCFSNQKDMAKTCRLDLKTVKSGLRELERRNMIAKTQRQGHTCLYRVTPMIEWVEPGPKDTLAQTAPQGVKRTATQAKAHPNHLAQKTPQKVPTRKLPQKVTPLLDGELERARLRVGGWFERRPSQSWSNEEIQLLEKVVSETHPDDWKILDTYYRSGHKYLKQTPKGLMSEWTSQIDKAKAWKRNSCDPNSFDRNKGTMNEGSAGSYNLPKIQKNAVFPREIFEEIEIKQL